ncbi:uncharacterized protein LOC133843402 isoform X3 [Drosophila sulfurigaster albostrigata]|uniref:uncharacterized protein LOC133843402 isoform X3 n=1 Tax=Drosophila sulfurigaster albostrigata TaxID=89887 RepID=UPI002D21E3D6|nr:uncharacterized protein LOC133843402 isoform X3 [Drosophila sulfurigaster albostrigata]
MPQQSFKLMLMLLLILFSTLDVFSELPQCFHFTWIGPYENKSNLPKENCDSRVGDFNGIPCEMPLVATIQNITYMCAKVNSTNGCFRQRHSTGMQVEACVCTSKVGLIPCNVGSTKTTTTRNHILGLALAFYGVFNMFIIVK